MRLVSWNVGRAGQARIPYQVAALAAREPDIAALQEVRINRVAEYRSALHRAGFPYVTDGFDGGAGPFTGRRAAGVLVASRWECAPMPEAHAACDLPWPERLLSLAIDAPCGPIAFHTVYVPVGFPNRDYDARIRTLDGLANGLARETGMHRILCGDFNLPLHELADGEVITFGQIRRKNGVFAITNAAMHASERAVLLGLADFDLIDVYRTLHGYARQEFSWYHPVSNNGFRLDHVLASRSLRPCACRYLDDFRTVAPERFTGHTFTKLSDHAAMEVDFEPATTG